MRKPIENYLDFFMNTNLNYISIGSRLVSQPKNKSILINGHKYLFTKCNFNPRGRKLTNSQSNPGTVD